MINGKRETRKPREYTPEEQERDRRIHAELLELLWLRDRRGLDRPVTQKELWSWMSPSLGVSINGVSTALSIMERKGQIEIVRDYRLNVRRDPNRYRVVIQQPVSAGI